MRKAYIYILILSIFILAILLLQNNVKNNSEEYVSLDEMAAMLSFSYYNENEWLEILEDNTSKEITYDDIDNILVILGISEYVANPYTGEKGSITYNEWSELYYQIVDILDTSNMVTNINTTVTNVNEDTITTEYGDFLYKYSHWEFEIGQNVKLTLLNNYILKVELSVNKEKTNLTQRKNIRVLIKNSNDIGYNNIVLTSTTPYSITNSTGTVSLNTGDEYIVNLENYDAASKHIDILPADGGKIIIKNSTKANSGYRGKVEISKVKDKLVLINDLTVEEYLYGVVPSEMPVSFGLEALKAQAVCARSFAYRQMSQCSYSEYDADVDDSVAYQVYNNTMENDLSIQAVNETSGQVMVYNGEIIQACYYSTSCGYTTDIASWGDNTELEYPYLNSRVNNDTNENIELTDEAIFVSFINNVNYASYDISSKWYRWNTTVNISKSSETINNIILKIHEQHPQKVLVQNENGEFVQGNISKVGAINSIQPALRNKGGCLNELIINEDCITIKIISEYNVRKVLGSSGGTINLKDGSTAESSGVLPSAFFYINGVNNGEKITDYTINGGGYGHGIGLSQYGARGMAESGMGFEDILKFYYKGIEIIGE